jgi:pimeloyl-ACP methyl ester carboxylesterase
VAAQILALDLANYGIIAAINLPTCSMIFLLSFERMLLGGYVQFVLVHGTFSSNRTWTVFATELRREDPSICLDHWLWTGANAQGGRMESARELGCYLNDKKKTFPDQPLILVGHSHGGNVCRAAASFAKPGVVQAIIYIATPHLLFERKRGRALACFLYSMLAAITLATVSTGSLITARLVVSLSAELSGTPGLIFSYAACIIVQGVLLFGAARVLNVRNFRKTRLIRPLIRVLLTLRRSSIRRNCFAPRSIPELNIVTKRDEAYLYLRLLQAESWTYQWGIKANFFVTGAMFFFAAILLGVSSVDAAVNTVFYLGGLVGNPKPIEWSEVLADLSFLVVVPLMTAITLLLALCFYWRFYGAPWNYGIKFIFDLFFVALSVKRSLPGQTTHPISIPFWERLRRMTLLHFAIHRDPATARAALDWAKAQVSRTAPLR